MLIDRKIDDLKNVISATTDILENDIRRNYPDVLETLLIDRTTENNIFWATNNYTYLGKGYEYDSQVLPKQITGRNGSVIMPRVNKDKLIQQSRIRDMAEVFTPSWICNTQNNLIDNAWLGYKNAFNTEHIDDKGRNTWQTNSEKIIFPNGKNWQDYVNDTRLEITCGEAPYITSRYDTTTGIFIPVENRIGLLDRKLRVINENVSKETKWLEAARTAFENIYAYEWQGDSLMLAREAMLFTFIENYLQKFDNELPLKSIQEIADIISWNVWQMDGLKGVVPKSCSNEKQEVTDLFGGKKNVLTTCLGCSKNNITKHNGIYCLIMDWSKKEKIKFINTIK